MHASAPCALAAMLVATVAPALGAQSGSEASAAPGAPAASLAPGPAGIVAAHQAPAAIPSAVPEAWSRSLARADSLAERKRAFHVGAVGGAALASGYALALMQPWKGDRGETKGPDARAVGAVMLLSAIPGAVLGGFTGVIVHDVHRAATRR